MTLVAGGARIKYPSFSPEGKWVAYVLENNLYAWDIAADTAHAVTTDGLPGSIINGYGDGVYEAGLGLKQEQAFAWSPDGQYLAFLRLPEVPDSGALDVFDTKWSKEEKLPGQKPQVDHEPIRPVVGIWSCVSGQVRYFHLGDELTYLAGLQWAPQTSALSVLGLNRLQNHLKRYLIDAKTGTIRLFLEERDAAYLPVWDDLTFLESKNQYLRRSEASGWNHIYLHELEGGKVRQLTRGEWEVTALYGVDEAEGWVYFQAALHGPRERQVCRIRLDGKDLEEVAEEPGWNSAVFDKLYKHFILTHSAMEMPPRLGLYQSGGQVMQQLEENSDLMERHRAMGFRPAEFFRFQTPDQWELQGWLMKPLDFQPQARYPLVLVLSGEPGGQLVTDSWGGELYAWYRYLTQRGFLVAGVDFRGTSGRGAAFRKATFLKLGQLETDDLVAAARYLGNLPYVDAGRMALYGEHFGGYLATMGMLKGGDLFTAGIAVAPVNHRTWYNPMFEAQHMRTEKKNPPRYDEQPFLPLAGQLQGKYLILHDMADLRVPFQHTAAVINVLINEGKPFDSGIYPMRSPDMAEGKVQLHKYRRMTDFLMVHLRGGEIKTRIPMNPRVEMMRTLQESKRNHQVPIKD